MRFISNYQYSLVVPLMILIAIVGALFSSKREILFYLPLALTGVYIIISKEYHRQKSRKFLLNKIKFFRKSK